MGIRTTRHASSHVGYRRAFALSWVVAGLAAAALLSACGGAAAVKLPPKASNPPPGQASPSVAATTSSKQAVTDAYLAFWPASSQAEKTGNATSAEAILSAYVSPGYISYMISGMQSAWSKNEISYGASVDHIQSVIVATLNSGEQTAEVQDCQNDSGSGLANAKTGVLVPGTLGSAAQELYTSLSLVNGHWLIDQVTFVGDTCTG